MHLLTCLGRQQSVAQVPVPCVHVADVDEALGSGLAQLCGHLDREAADGRLFSLSNSADQANKHFAF